jgi:hypothetical protein
MPKSKQNNWGLAGAEVSIDPLYGDRDKLAGAVPVRRSHRVNELEVSATNFPFLGFERRHERAPLCRTLPRSAARRAGEAYPVKQLLLL